MEALHNVVKAGKARYIGASSMWAWQFSKMQYTAELHNWTKFVSMQDQYNLVAREEEREMYPLLADQGVGAIPWSPLAAGLVTRPWGESSTTRSRSNPRADPSGRPLWLETDKGTVDAVQAIAEARDVSMAQIALAWTLRLPNVISIPKAGREAHVRENRGSADIVLTAADLAALDAAFPPPTRKRSLEML